jgi:hypothetical protein
MKNPEKVDWSYLAGLFDGEGTFSIYHQRQYESTAIRIEITNTKIELMEWLVQHFGGQYYSHRRSSPKHCIAYGWRPKGRTNSEHLLLGLLPYLVIKKEQAKVALEYVRLPHNNGVDPELAKQRKEMLTKMQSLNKRGSLSVETNTQETSQEVKRESDLVGDSECERVVIPVGTGKPGSLDYVYADFVGISKSS